MRVSVDKERCCGAGQCVMTAPDVFDQSDEDGVVLLRAERPAAALLSELELAAALCPAHAITVEGDPETATRGSDDTART
ncbi:ferredoxin [Streptomyces sp. NPDC017993]|uniref:ferredoxin n=1 Tax=Streptomyces sp. NPDC017993 TaxID=3365027 RepID=UPI00379DC0B9